MPHNKVVLRKLLRARRNQLSSATQALHAKRVAALFIESDDFKNATRVACYLAADGEVDMMPLITALLSANKVCYLPIVKMDSKQLHFARYKSDTPLLANRFGILEPQQTDILTPDALDIILIPVVGFDQAGHRLGRGAGFYDRTLQGLKNPCFIGVAHSCQVVDSIPFDSHDVSLHKILTEEGFWVTR